jgi:hypothetical protein
VSVGFPDWNRQVTHVTSARIVDNAAGQPVAINGSFQSGLLNMPLPAYGLSLSVANSAGGDVLSLVTVILNWYDITGNLLLHSDTWGLAAGAFAAGPHELIGRGPAAGDTLRLIVTNLAVSAEPVTLSYTVASLAKTLTRPVLETQNLSIGGLTDAAADLTENRVISSRITAVGAGAAVIRGLPLMAGQLYLGCSTDSAANNGEFSVQPIPGFITQTHNIWGDYTDAHGNLAATIQLPRFQCQATMTNHDAAARTLAMWGVLGEVRT